MYPGKELYMSELTHAIEVAIRIEKISLDFYVTLSEMVPDAEIKDFFNTLAAEEESHVGFYREFLKNISGNRGKFRYEGDYESFLRAVANKAVKTFDKLKENLSLDHFDDAVQLANDLELDAIAFFSELEKQYEGREKELLHEIIEEEKRHLSLIRKIKAEKHYSNLRR